VRYKDFPYAPWLPHYPSERQVLLMNQPNHIIITTIVCLRVYFCCYESYRYSSLQYHIEYFPYPKNPLCFQGVLWFGLLMYFTDPFWVSFYMWYKYGPNFILLHKDIQLSQHHLLKDYFSQFNEHGTCVKNQFVGRIPRWQLEGGSRKQASYSKILERCWRHTLQAKSLRRGKILTPPHLQPVQRISTSR
jgi:hypothetical protein